MILKLPPPKLTKDELMTRKFDKRGRQIDLDKWAELINDWDYSRVKQQRTPGNTYYVSTVWIGLEGDLFETMVFGNRNSLEEKRYDTLAEAKAGHEKLYAKYAKLDKIKIDVKVSED